MSKAASDTDSMTLATDAASHHPETATAPRWVDLELFLPLLWLTGLRGPAVLQTPSSAVQLGPDSLPPSNFLTCSQALDGPLGMMEQLTSVMARCPLRICGKVVPEQNVLLAVICERWVV